MFYRHLRAAKAKKAFRFVEFLDTLQRHIFKTRNKKAIEFIKQAVALDRNNLDHFKLQRNKFLEEIVKSK